MLPSDALVDRDDRSFWRRILDFVFGYDFFISYAWSDATPYAAGLARQLEARRFAVFLDRTKYAAGDDWKKVGAWTLRRTGQLILIGSPAAFRSAPVLRELTVFGSTGRRIVPIDFAGSTDTKAIGPDFAKFLTPDIIRVNEDGSFLRSGPSEGAVATIANTFELITQNKKRVRILASIVVVLGALTVLATWLGVSAESQRSIAQKRLEDTIEIATGINDSAMHLSGEYGVHKDTVVKFLGLSEKALGVLSDHKESDRIKAMQAHNLIAQSDQFAEMNDSKAQLGAAEHAVELMTALVTAHPENDEWLALLSEADDRIGKAYFVNRNSDDALIAHERQLKIDEGLLAKRPADRGRRRQIAVTQERIGTVLQFQGKLQDALSAQGASLAITQSLAADKPGDANLQRDLAVSYEKMAELLALQGNNEKALENQEDALSVRFQLASAAPNDTRGSRDLMVSYNKVGQLLVAQSQSLAQQDRAIDAQRKLGDARQAHQSALEIAKKLVNSDPGNTEWQADLAAAHLRLGDVLFAEEKSDQALAEYSQTKDIVEPLATANPTQTFYSYDLAGANERIGDVQLQKGQFDKAIESYSRKLDLDLHLVATDPRNSEFKRDLLISYVKVGDGLRKSNRSDSRKSVEYFAKALAIAEKLKSDGQLNPDDEWMIADLKKGIGD
jgi:tetratricopeptide (TPR) repeat protein